MFRIDGADAVGSLPAFGTAGTPGYFADGTHVSRDWFNGVQEELMTVLAAAGIAPAKGTSTQLRDAILALVGPGLAAREVGLAHILAANTAGPTYTAAANWQAVPLNTKQYDTGNRCSLAANQIILGAGTWRIDAAVAFGETEGRGVLRLRNVTAGATLVVGLAGGNEPAVLVNDPLLLRGRFTVAVGQTLEVQLRTPITTTTCQPVNLGESEVYATVLLTALS